MKRTIIVTTITILGTINISSFAAEYANKACEAAVQSSEHLQYSASETSLSEKYRSDEGLALIANLAAEMNIIDEGTYSKREVLRTLAFDLSPDQFASLRSSARSATPQEWRTNVKLLRAFNQVEDLRNRTIQLAQSPEVVQLAFANAETQGRGALMPTTVSMNSNVKPQPSNLN